MESVIKNVEQTNHNRRQFRTVARNSTGETFEPPTADLLFFTYVNRDVVAVGSYQSADLSVTEPTPSTDVNTSYAHIVSYVFVLPRVQRHGFGAAIMSHMEKDMSRRVPGRPCRLQASRQAVGFFERLGFQCVGEPVRPVCPGSMRFSELYTMEKIM